VIAVVLDAPHGTQETYGFATAGWNSAPTAGTIIAKIAPMLGVFPLGHQDNFEPLGGLIASGAFAGPNDYARATKVANTVPAMMMDELQTPVITTEPVAAVTPAVAPTAIPATKTSAPLAAAHKDSIAALISTPAVTGDVGETQ
jgi:hypothetical protein